MCYLLTGPTETLAIPRYRLPVILAAEILMRSARKQKARDFLDLIAPLEGTSQQLQKRRQQYALTSLGIVKG